jgi:hypothetical protein
VHAGGAEEASLLPVGLLGDVDLTALLASDDLRAAMDDQGAPASAGGAAPSDSSAGQAPTAEQSHGVRGMTRGPGGPPDHRMFDGSREGDRMPGQHGPPRLTPDLVARSLEVAGDVDQELAERLSKAHDKDPQEFERLMRQGGIGWRLMSMAQLKQRDPELYRAKVSELSTAIQIERVAKQLRDARRTGSAGDAEAYEHQLRTLLQIQLAMSIKARGDILCRLEERMGDIRKDLEHEASNFQSTIEARMKMLTTEPPAANTAAEKADAAPADKTAPAAVPASDGK